MEKSSNENSETNLDKIESVTNKIGDSISNALIEKEKEFAAEQEKLKSERLAFRSRDISILFQSLALFTIAIMGVQFICWYSRGITLDIDIIKFANVLNVAIVFIGCSEGIRSFCKTATEEVGVSSPVPAYKLRYLLKYMIVFVLISVYALILEYYCKTYPVNNTTYSRPIFAGDSLLSGLLSNVIAYLMARFGSKLSSEIDLSSLTFFKRKS